MGLQRPQEFENLIREKLPEVLRRRPEFRYEIVGIMAETLATKEDLAALLERVDAHLAQLQQLREESERRFEEANRRFEESDRRFDSMLARLQQLQEESERRFEESGRRFEESGRRIDSMLARLQRLQEESERRFEESDRRFEAVVADLRDLRLEVSALSGRLGRGMEEIVRQTVERFSGEKFEEVRRLVLKDDAGELYGVPAEVEFDVYLRGRVSYVVEVKSHVKTGDVLNFYRKKVFAEAKLGGPLKGLLIGASIDRLAKKKCRELGLEVIARSAV